MPRSMGGQGGVCAQKWHETQRPGWGGGGAGGRCDAPRPCTGGGGRMSGTMSGVQAASGVDGGGGGDGVGGRRGGVWVENAGAVRGSGGAGVGGGVAARRHVARWWEPMRVSGWSSWTVGVSNCCRHAACARVEASICSCAHLSQARRRGGEGPTAQPTEARGGDHHQRCFGTRAGARLRGAPRGARAERAGVRSGVRANLHRDEEVLWRHVWRSPPPLPHPSSIAPRPNTSRATRWRRRPRAGTPLKRRATDSSTQLRLQSGEGGEGAVRTGGCRCVRSVQSAPAGARGWGKLGPGRSRRARGACRCRGARVGARWRGCAKVA